MGSFTGDTITRTDPSPGVPAGGITRSCTASSWLGVMPGIVKVEPYVVEFQTSSALHPGAKDVSSIVTVTSPGTTPV